MLRNIVPRGKALRRTKASTCLFDPTESSSGRIAFDEMSEDKTNDRERQPRGKRTHAKKAHKKPMGCKRPKEKSANRRNSVAIATDDKIRARDTQQATLGPTPIRKKQEATNSPTDNPADDTYSPDDEIERQIAEILSAVPPRRSVQSVPGHLPGHSLSKRESKASVSKHSLESDTDEEIREIMDTVPSRPISPRDLPALTPLQAVCVDNVEDCACGKDDENLDFG